MIEEAKSLVKQAEAAHAASKHGLAEAQAKAAKYLAEQVK
jgi:F0F1-type ATP synthase membrane subunit b/b'